MRPIKFEYLFKHFRHGDYKRLVMRIEDIEEGNWGFVGEWEDDGYHCEARRQYIGLQDKNGKGREMYEGDVYKQVNRHYVIEWSEQRCGWVVRSLTSNTVLPGQLQDEIAVYDNYEYIGSIYEHPHLIES